MYHTVTLLSPPYDTLTYARPVWWPEAAAHIPTPGLRVAVPLGKSLRAGILLDAGSVTCDVPKGVSIRPFVWPLEASPLLDAGYMEMARHCALRQGRSVGNVLAHVLPKGLRGLSVCLHCHADGRRYSLAQLHVLPEENRASLALALASQTAHILPTGTADDTMLCTLAVDMPWPVRPRAVLQKAVLEYLHEHGPRPRSALLTALRTKPDSGEGTARALDTLLRHGHIALRPADAEAEEYGTALLPPPEVRPSFTLSEAQNTAVATLINALDYQPASCHLLFGVTGSGKTAVYLELIRACHARGKSVLLLAPEVAIAQKLQRDARAALPHIPAYLYHGYQSQSRREHLFRRIATDTVNPCVIVGTRSALFLPLRGLGAIILDEEHDASYKQDEKLPYHAKEIAWFLASQSKIPLVLGSATPDVRTFYAASPVIPAKAGIQFLASKKEQPSSAGGISLARLPERVGGGRLPDIKLVDISSPTTASLTAVNKTNGANTPGLEELAPESVHALKETLVRGEQAVVLLNRRGYAPRMYCLDCHTVSRCPLCEIALTYHKGRERLLCHYCGHSTPYPAACMQCRSMRFLPMGEGTEKLAESLRALAPLHTILRLDRDSTRRPGRIEEILESFARQEAQILVGTQMLSKGHHFPNVTLALLVDGDLGLNLPDYRAAETTFQLLVQAAGRAGRGDKPGRVLIQTRDTRHYCWDYIVRGDYDGFCAAELARRKLRHYPPFVRLALIRISYAVDNADGPEALTALAACVRREGRATGLTVLGPTPAPIAVIGGRRRFHCLLKSPIGPHDWSALRAIYALACRHPSAKHLRLFLDLDPVNMM